MLFRSLDLHKDKGTLDTTLKAIYDNCIDSVENKDSEAINHVKALYDPFSQEEVSAKIAALLTHESISCEVKIIYQTVEGLHQSCPENKGDWYFTGNYPTPGGNRVVNRAFMNFFEGKSERAY